MRNPFSPGAGSPPPELVGRAGVLEDAAVLFARVQKGRAEKSLSPRRAKLLNKGMIYSPAYGQLAFTVPLFGDFLKRVMPNV